MPRTFKVTAKRPAADGSDLRSRSWRKDVGSAAERGRPSWHRYERRKIREQLRHPEEILEDLFASGRKTILYGL